MRSLRKYLLRKRHLQIIQVKYLQVSCDDKEGRGFVQVWKLNDALFKSSGGVCIQVNVSQIEVTAGNTSEI